MNKFPLVLIGALSFIIAPDELGSGVGGNWLAAH